jgi:hypothetical protein
LIRAVLEDFSAKRIRFVVKKFGKAKMGADSTKVKTALGIGGTK